MIEGRRKGLTRWLVVEIGGGIGVEVVARALSDRRCSTAELRSFLVSCRVTRRMPQLFVYRLLTTRTTGSSKSWSLVPGQPKFAGLAPFECFIDDETLPLMGKRPARRDILYEVYSEVKEAKRKYKSRPRRRDIKMLKKWRAGPQHRGN